MADLEQAAVWHRQIAGLVSAADRTGVATTDLPTLRSRLFTQKTRFAEAAARGGAPLPALVPTPTEIAAAAASLGDMSDAVVGRAMQSAEATLEAVDAELARVMADQPSAPTVRVAEPAVPAPVSAVRPDPARPAVASAAPAAGPSLPQSPPTVRNGLIYGGYAVAVTCIQLVLFYLLDEQNSLLAASPLCLLVLPAFAWLAGWLTIGVTARTPPGQPTNRSPRLGAVICAMPDLLLCGVLGVLVALNLAQR